MRRRLLHPSEPRQSREVVTGYLGEVRKILSASLDAGYGVFTYTSHGRFAYNY